MTDTTERKRLEQKVSETERLLRHAAENANDSIYLTDEKGLFTYANPSTSKTSGYTGDELIGKNYLDLIVPEYRKEVERFYGLQFVKKVPSTYYELPIRTKQGNTVWIGQQVQLIMDGSRVVGFQSICRDIDARPKAEEALRESEERLRQFADTIQDIIMFISPESPYRFTYVSPAYERITGRKVDELYEDPTSWTECIHTRDREKATAFFESFVQNGRDLNNEVRIVGPSGDVRWIWCTGFPIKDSDGNVQRLAINVRDVTQRKLDAEQLKHLVEEIKDFAYIVSHDFRAPLINIKGFAGELESAIEILKPAAVGGLPGLNENQKSQVLTALDEDVPAALGFIRSSVSKMDSLINAILDLSRLERRELNFEPLDMDRLMEETLKTFTFQLNEANAHVSVGKLPETVAYRVAMEQILKNLLSNATKFRDPKRRQEISINGYRFPDETVFVLRDRGRGIEKVYLSQIFQLFHRGSIRDVPGEGMGLAHVRALVRRHGGRIWCESGTGVGSTFTFTISNHLPQRGRDEQSEPGDNSTR
jgi:PAS domain S-box-containing protein